MYAYGGDDCTFLTNEEVLDDYCHEAMLDVPGVNMVACESVGDGHNCVVIGSLGDREDWIPVPVRLPLRSRPPPAATLPLHQSLLPSLWRNGIIGFYKSTRIHAQLL